MCCPGCQAVARAIVDGGLSDYYRHRTATAETPGGLDPELLRRLDLYDQPRLQDSFVEVDAANLRHASLILEGIVCAACVWLNERHVRSLPGVVEFHVNYSTHRARVAWDETRIHLSGILKAIAAIGYVAHPFDPGRQEAVYKRERSLALRRLAVAALGAMQVMMLAVAMYAGAYEGMDPGLRQFMRWVSLLVATPVVFYSAQTFFISAWRDLKYRQLGMDVPVSLAIGGAYLASAWATLIGSGEIYFDSVCMFSFFLLSSRFLEMGARHRAGQVAEQLVRLLPASATRLDGDAETVVAVAELIPGDRVLIRPGESIPADGTVLEGTSSVDESLLTGESMPRTHAAGAALVGGTLNVESPLVMRVAKVGEDTTLAAIARLLDRAQTEKPRIARLADRVAAWFVGALLAIAGLVAWWWWQHSPADAFRVTLSVLVVTCPCALSLATPVALTAATGALTRRGLLTTRGYALETLARATHMMFDKTGTLTQGRLRLTGVRVLGDVPEDECLRMAAALERRSEHPVAKVLVAVTADLPRATAVVATPGKGMQGEIEGHLYRVGSPAWVAELSASPPHGEEDLAGTCVALGGTQGVQALFELEDEPRPDAGATVDRLRDLGLQVELLSGDAPPAVVRVANSLGIEAYQAAMTPQDKLERVRELQRGGAVVAMVGDGVNDAPVLAGSQVSVAMGGGTQLAHASADMVVLSEHLDRLPNAVQKARRTVRVIRQNLTWAVLYNVLAIPLAAAGYLAPWMAALGMSASSLVVVVNALRLRR